MRRSDREVKDIRLIRQILDECKTCRLAMVDDGYPYVVPLSYAYEIEDEILTVYFHSAQKGRKIDILRQNNAVCFEMSKEGEPVHAVEDPCNSGYYYKSVIGFGNVYFLDDPEEKCAALSRIMKHQADMEVRFTRSQAQSVCVFKAVANVYTGKMKPHPASSSR